MGNLLSYLVSLAKRAEDPFDTFSNCNEVHKSCAILKGAETEVTIEMGAHRVT